MFSHHPAPTHLVCIHPHPPPCTYTSDVILCDVNRLNDMVVNILGQRKAELTMLQGPLYNPDQALDFGFVDRVVPHDELLGLAQAEAAKWAKIPSRYLSERLISVNQYVCFIMFDQNRLLKMAFKLKAIFLCALIGR